MSKNKHLKKRAMHKLSVGCAVVLSASSVVTPLQSVLVSAETNKTGKYYTAFDNYDQEQEAAYELNEEIAGESIVLLKNRDNALPLREDENAVTAFGIGSAYTSYGAQGSGTQSASEQQHLVTFAEGLENAGIQVNPEVLSLYKQAGAEARNSTSKETSVGSDDLKIVNSDLKPEQLETARTSYPLYDDAAVVVITREGGEGEKFEFSRSTYYGGAEKEEGDEYAHGLMLTPTERETLQYAEENFDKVIVLINSTNVMELGELEDDDNVDAVLWVGAPGVSGFNSVGKVLTGKINPSGHTSDIYPANLTEDPTWFNYADQSGVIQMEDEYAGETAGEVSKAYDSEGNTIDMSTTSTAIETVSYLEGIYMGYRWYETQAELGNYYAADSMPNNDDATYDTSDTYYNRDNGVVYPFGYGLSYTTFDWSNFTANLSEDGTQITVSVDVTNTGSVAGKDVVQIYYKDPYYDGQIEKASANLVEFVKTDNLQPGETQTVTTTFDVKDMASFDYNDANGNGFSGYELDAGDYVISARSDSHTVRAEAVITLDAFMYDGSDDAHNYNAGYGENSTAIFSATDSSSEDWMYNSAGDPEVQTYISRAGGTLSQPKAVMNAQYSDEWKERLTAFQTYTAANAKEYNEKYNTVYVNDEGIPSTWTQAEEGTEDVTQIQLSDMIGVDYPTYGYDSETNTVTEGDDEATQKWDEFLNQLTVTELKNLVGSDHGNSAAVERFGLPQSYCNDGPSKLQSKNSAIADINDVKYDGTWWASEVNIASTFNTDLAYQQGLMIGNESLYEGVTGMWGFGLNTHRGAWGARTFEYYSEDGILGGYIAAAVTKGCTDMGVVVYNKHFALNDQDSYRNTADGCAVFVNEQALRQIYLKPFEIAVKKGGMNGAMMSFMRVGAVSADNNYNLIDKTLRGEWGFKGDICTDAGGGYCGDACILAGNDWPLMSYSTIVTGEWDSSANNVTIDGEVNSTQYYALRKSAMHFLYGVVNSNAMRNEINTAAFTATELTANNGRETNLSVAASLEDINASSAEYALKSGELPAGLTLGSDGSITGTPEEIGTFNFTVRMTADKYVYSECEFVLTVNKIFDASNLQGKVGEDFECYITSEIVTPGDEFESVEYTAEGLPAGLTIAEDGTIYGTPEEAGSFDVTIQATAVAASSGDMPDMPAGMAPPAGMGFGSSNSTFKEVITIEIAE